MDYYDEIGEELNYFISERESKYQIDLNKRLLNFSVNTIKFLQTLPYKKEYDVFRYQLSKSATSIGANFEEAQSTTYKEFIQKLRIALRESNETKYWFKVINELKISNKNQLKYLQKEIDEISRILGSIVSKADKTIRNKK